MTTPIHIHPFPFKFNCTRFDAIDHNGQVWLTCPQIGDALGYTKNRKVSEIYNKHADEFTASMTALLMLPTPGGIQEVRVFSLRGAHLIGMFARTPRAADFRRWVLDILDTHADDARAISPPHEQDRCAIAFDETKGLQRANDAAHDALRAAHGVRALADLCNLRLSQHTDKDSDEAFATMLSEQAQRACAAARNVCDYLNYTAA